MPLTADVIRRRARTIGWHRWLPEEYRVVDRYAKALAQGRISGMGVADAQCREELARMAVAAGRDPRRLPATVRKLVGTRGRLHGWNWAQSVWQADEKRVLERYVRECVRGRSPTIEAAARACWKEMRATCSRVGRPLRGVHVRLLETTREQGRQPFRRWTAEETQVVVRHVRLLFEGRYHYIRQAAEACARELRRRHEDLSVAYPPRPAPAIYQRMTNLVPKYRLPRHKGEMTVDEKKVVERYARAIGRGEYENARIAAAACLAELRGGYRQARKSGAIRVRNVTGHSVHTIHWELLCALQRLKLFVLSGRLWTREEQRVCEAWLRWYESGRRATKRRFWRDAAEGMREELAEKGYRRTAHAVDAQLKVTRRRQRGMER